MGILEKIFADPKTSWTAIIGGVAQLVAVYGFEVSPQVQVAIVTIIVFVLGLVSRDTNDPPPQIPATPPPSWILPPPRKKK